MIQNILTEKQKILLEIVKEQGFITLPDVQRIYSTNPDKQLKRLIELGYLEEDYEHLGRFKLRK